MATSGGFKRFCEKGSFIPGDGKDRKEEAEAGSAQGVSMVQEASPRLRKGAVAEPVPESAWTLRVLWDHVQLTESE